jgi:GNAT superfamily N-acetyltransferase
MNIEIADADSRDVPAMARLLADLFSVEADFQPDTGKQERALRLIQAYPDRGRLFVARRRRDVIGMANALFSISTAEGGPVVVLEDVIVAADHRDAGIGTRLVDHILDWARREGYLRVTLLTDAGNSGAIRFYERRGFARSAMIALRRNL